MTLTKSTYMRAMTAVIFCMLMVATARSAAAATITLGWDPNPASDSVTGYKVYIGTLSGVYGNPVDVGNVTTYAYTSAAAGQLYFFAVSAYTATGTGSPLSPEISGAVAVAPDLIAPTISISSPTSAATYSTTASAMSLGGTASDNVSVSQVSYTVNGGASTSASGTTSWTVSTINLQFGTNTIVVTARDLAGNTATATLTVTRTDVAAPLVSIVVPTGSATYSTQLATLAVSGTASDNNAVTQVTYTLNGGASTATSGMTNWSVASLPLVSGANAVVVTARDAAGNTGTDTLTVTYTPDTTAPAVSITSPTSAATFSTTAATISLGGTASDTVGVTQVSYTVNGGASTNASGMTSWTASSVAMQVGTNAIVVTARDAAGNTATDTLTVTRTDAVVPTATITSPTSSTSYSTPATSLNIGGTASDNVGVTQVTWATNTGQSGTASGTTSWSVAGILLRGGANVITVTSRDAAGNTGSDTLTVTATYTSTVSAVSVSPSSGNGSSGTFAYRFSDTAGTINITQGWVWINASFAATSANSCMFYFDQVSNQIKLLDDAGVNWQPATLGASGTLQNTSCAIALASSNVTFSGTTMTLNVALSFGSGYAGAKNVYMYAANGGGSNSGWQTLGSWTVPSAAPLGSVTADSATPNTGSGSSQTFVLKYSHSAGAGNLAQTWVWFNPTMASAANSCMAYYNRPTNQVFLINDAGQAWNSAVLGTGGTLQNGSCSIGLATSSATASGNTLTVNLAVTFASSFAGAKNIYMYGSDLAGNNSGWQTRGTWTVSAGAAAVTADSSTPNAGSGISQTFGLSYSDTTGAANLTSAWVWFNATFAASSANSCMVYYDKATNQVNVINDTGTGWMSMPLGGGGTLANSSCSVALTGTSVSSSGNTLTLNLAMTFAAGYAGAKNIYMYGTDASTNSGWQTRGTWTVTSSASAVTADTITPNAGSGATQSFVLKYSDTGGGVNLTQAWVWFNVTMASTSANSCMAYYDKTTNKLNLINDAGTAWLAASLGTSGTLQNSSCSIALASSSISISGNTLTLTLATTFKPAFAGTKDIYMYGANASQNSGWQIRGSWIVP